MRGPEPKFCRMKSLAIALIVVIGARPVLAQQGVFDHELIAAREAVWKAFFSNDTVALRRYIPAAAATLEGGARRRWNTRADIMASAQRFSESKAKLVSITFSNTSIVYAAQT